MKRVTNNDGDNELTRGDFLRVAGIGTGVLILGGCKPLTSSDSRGRADRTARASRATEYVLKAAPMSFDLGGREISTWGYNGGVPGPEIRAKEGDTLRVRVSNRLPEGTTIHWHGLPIPNRMDGVPDVTQKPIGKDADFTYEFEVPVSGTYFYHSHAGLQLDRAVYGPLILEPRKESLSYDREFTLMLDDWLDGVDGTPEDELRSLKSGGSAMGDMGGMGGMKGMGGGGMKGTGSMKGMGGMGEAPRQWPPDVAYPFYLVNGKPADAPEELKVKRGEKIRLRFINPSSATIYRVALQGHRMSVVHADGGAVEPVEVDSFRIGMGERYDVLVEAKNPGVWQLGAQAEGTKKIGRAVLRYYGSTASAPPADFKPPELGRKLLLYDMLKAAPHAKLPPGGEPDRVVPITLSGDEKKYIWKINGQVFSKADPISVGRDEHIRFEIENTTMMPHPMHLHGHFFQVETGDGRGPMKDTVLVDPKQKVSIDWLSDNSGKWAFHCHMIYHQDAGMMRVVDVA